MKITVYGTKDCPWTDEVLDMLNTKNKKHDFKDVVEDFAAREELFSKTKQYSTPVCEIDGNIILGMDKDKIAKLIA
ncbi:MAG: glutaredoxin domain-containing protein [Candidatus Woesearchaeota archaeon]